MKNRLPALIRAQGGCIVKVDGRWWWYGIDTNPGPDGAPVNSAVRCYSSTNLTQWASHGQVLTDRVPPRVQVARTGDNRLWSGNSQVKQDTGMSSIDGVLEVKGTEGSFLLYYGSRYSQITTLGVGRNVMTPWGIDPKDATETLVWQQSWWLDAAKGTWSKSKEQNL